MLQAALLLCLAPVATDGDTLRCGASGASVRIFGIQAPERGQAGWVESMNNLALRSVGGVVCEPRGTNFSRIVGLCRNARGEDVGKAQLDGSFAKEWGSYSRNYYKTCQ